MPNIKKSEIEFLEQLDDKLKNYVGFRKDHFQLKDIISRLRYVQISQNEKTKDVVNERRKQDPTYGRSEKEKEKIKARQEENKNV